jgi:hypothetical protein
MNSLYNLNFICSKQAVIHHELYFYFKFFHLFPSLHLLKCIIFEHHLLLVEMSFIHPFRLLNQNPWILQFNEYMSFNLKLFNKSLWTLIMQCLALLINLAIFLSKFYSFLNWALSYLFLVAFPETFFKA